MDGEDDMDEELSVTEVLLRPPSARPRNWRLLANIRNTLTAGPAEQLEPGSRRTRQQPARYDDSADQGRLTATRDKNCETPNPCAEDSQQRDPTTSGIRYAPMIDAPRPSRTSEETSANERPEQPHAAATGATRPTRPPEGDVDLWEDPSSDPAGAASWVGDLRAALEADALFQATSTRKDPHAGSLYIQGGLLFQSKLGTARMYIPDHSDWRRRVLVGGHDVPWAGHFGVRRTTESLVEPHQRDEVALGWVSAWDPRDSEQRYRVVYEDATVHWLSDDTFRRMRGTRIPLALRERAN